MSGGLLVAGSGLVTPVGHDAPDTHMSVTAGIRRFRRGPVVGIDGHPLRVSPVMEITPSWTGLARRGALVTPALLDAVRAARAASTAPLTRAGLVLCPGLDDAAFVPRATARALVPSLTAALGATVPAARVDALPRGFAADDLLALVVDTLARDASVEVPAEHRAIVAGEHASGLVALDRAAEILARGAPFCLLASVDTMCEAVRLEILDAGGKIQSQRARSAPIPGEAAAVLCLAKPGGNALRRVVPRIAAWAHGADADADDPSMGVAWTRVVDAALAAAGEPRPLAFAMVDLNGDRARAQAWAFTAHRTLGPRGLTPAIAHPADTVGDVSAAAAPLMLSLAGARLWSEAPGAASLVACAATFGRERSAAIITLEGASG